MRELTKKSIYADMTDEEVDKRFKDLADSYQIHVGEDGGATATVQTVERAPEPAKATPAAAPAPVKKAVAPVVKAKPVVKPKKRKTVPAPEKPKQREPKQNPFEPAAPKPVVTNTETLNKHKGIPSLNKKSVEEWDNTHAKSIKPKFHRSLKGPKGTKLKIAQWLEQQNDEVTVKKKKK